LPELALLPSGQALLLAMALALSLTALQALRAASLPLACSTEAEPREHRP
jgi:hypothetical protein